MLRPYSPWFDQKAIAKLKEYGADSDAEYKPLVFRQRFGVGKNGCPNCHCREKNNFNYTADDYRCISCGSVVNPLIGTPMYKSRIPLVHWFDAMHRFMTASGGRPPIVVAGSYTDEDFSELYDLSLSAAHKMRMAVVLLVYPHVGHVWE